MAIVFVATANIAVLILAFHEHDRTAQLLSLATGATLVGALHLWTAYAASPTSPTSTTQQTPSLA